MSTVAAVGRIISMSRIDGADRIVSAEVVCGTFGKWMGVVQKDQFAVGQLCEVYLQDCVVPKTERFAFMEKHKWIVRMARFKGAPSECLVMPLTLKGRQIGDDIAYAMGCEKYVKPLPANMSGDALGNFPSFVPKTDELNFQSAPHVVAGMVGKPYYVTEKADGSSATIYKHEGHFGCCSRNLEMKDAPSNAIWQIARQYDLENRLTDGIVIQFEVVGPGIQSNPMGLKKVEPRLFSVYGIVERHYLGFTEVGGLSNYLDFPTVKLLETGTSFPDKSDDDLRVMAEGLYENGKQREGIVVRSQVEQSVNGDRLSFKVINLKYKG